MTISKYYSISLLVGMCQSISHGCEWLYLHGLWFLVNDMKPLRRFPIPARVRTTVSRVSEKNLRGTEKTFAPDKNNIGVFFKIKTRRQASWNIECVFLVCRQLTIKDMLFITLPSNLEKLSTRIIFKNKPRKPLLQGFKSLFANIVMDNTQHAFFGFKRYSHNTLITATPSEGAAYICGLCGKPIFHVIESFQLHALVISAVQLYTPNVL